MEQRYVNVCGRVYSIKHYSSRSEGESGKARAYATHKYGYTEIYPLHCGRSKEKQRYECLCAFTVWVGECLCKSQIEADFYYDDISEKRQILYTAGGLCLVETEKCKEILSNTITMPDGVELTVFSAAGKRACHIIYSDEPFVVSRRLLRSLLVKGELAYAYACVALCRGDSSMAAAYPEGKEVLAAGAIQSLIRLLYGQYSHAITCNDVILYTDCDFDGVTRIYMRGRLEK